MLPSSPNTYCGFSWWCQEGAIVGYSLLWLLLWSRAIRLPIQLLSARLGVVTGRHLAELCREEYPNWVFDPLVWCSHQCFLLIAEVLKLTSGYSEFIESAEKILEQRKMNQTLLANHSNLLDLLEIPRLMYMNKPCI